MEHWKRLLREVAESQSQEIFKKHVDTSCAMCSGIVLEMLGQMTLLAVPSYFNHFVILWMYEYKVHFWGQILLSVMTYYFAIGLIKSALLPTTLKHRFDKHSWYRKTITGQHSLWCLWYKHWNICVCRKTGDPYINQKYMDSYVSLPKRQSTSNPT